MTPTHATDTTPLITFPAGVSDLRFPVGPLHLHPGRYLGSPSMTRPKNIEHCIWYWDQETFVMEGDQQPLGGIAILLPYRGLSIEALPQDAVLAQSSHA